MSWVAVGATTVAAGTAAYGAYTAGGDEKVGQVPLETPEQRDARLGLTDFARTGTYGNYTAGTPYTGSLGNFAMTALESGAQNKLLSRLNSPGMDPNMQLSDQVLQDLLGSDKYNPLKPGGVYDSVTGGIDRATAEAQRGLKRASAFGGSLFSTDTIRGLGDIQGKAVDTKANTMANLFQNYIGQKLGAVPLGYQAALQKDTTARQNITDAYTYGGLPRTLSNAADQAKYTEFQRQRAEQQQQIQALTAAAGSSSNFGVPEVSIPKNDPWMDIASLLAQFGGSYAGRQAAKVPPAKAT